MNSHGGMSDGKKFSDYFEIQILKAYKKPFTMLVEEGTFISNHKGELLNSKSEWHQAKIIRTTTQVIQGGADLLRQQQGGRRGGLWGAGQDGGVEREVEVERREGRDQPQDDRVAWGPGASATTFSQHAYLIVFFHFGTEIVITLS